MRCWRLRTTTVRQKPGSDRATSASLKLPQYALANGLQGEIETVDVEAPREVIGVDPWEGGIGPSLPQLSGCR